MIDPTTIESQRFIATPDTKSGKIPGIVGGKIKNMNALRQYVVPRTEIDMQTGRLIYRNPEWKKLTGFGEQENDEQIALSHSALFDMIQQSSWAKRTGYVGGHGTYGYGRDSITGKPIVGTPPVISLDIEKLLERDINGEMHYKPGAEQYLTEIFTRGTEYGPDRYKVISQGESKITLLLDELYSEFENKAAQKNLPFVFQGLNYGGLAQSHSLDKTLKTLNYVRKIQSDSERYESVYGKFHRPVNPR